jgi:hypothetical protein
LDVVLNEHDILRPLAAGGPQPEPSDALMLFGRFVGSWDLAMTAFDDDGSSREFVGEWHFGWALQGRSVQDVLITRSLDGEVVGYGSTIRSLDAQRGVWWVVWQDPLAGEFSVLLARADGDRILLDGQWTIADDGREFRWAFSDITADSFRWQAHISEDGGTTWRLVEEMRALRRNVTPS